MINQVTLEGFVVSCWEYKGEAFLRIAHHQPHRQGEIIHSDYVTVRVDPQAAPPGAAEPRVELPAASRPAAIRASSANGKPRTGPRL